MITVNQRVENNSNNSVTLYPYGLIRRAGEPKTIDFFVLHEGPLGVFDGTLSEKSYGDLTEAGKKGINIKPNETGGWIGLTDKYWLTALLPDQNEKYNFTYRKLNSNGGQYQTDFLGKAVTVPSKSTGEFLSRTFAGAKRLALFDDYEERFNIIGIAKFFVSYNKNSSLKGTSAILAIALYKKIKLLFLTFSNLKLLISISE